MPFCFRLAPTGKPPSFLCSPNIEHWISGASHGCTCSPLEALCLIEPPQPDFPNPHPDVLWKSDEAKDIELTILKYLAHNSDSLCLSSRAL